MAQNPSEVTSNGSLGVSNAYSSPTNGQGQSLKNGDAAAASHPAKSPADPSADTLVYRGVKLNTSASSGLTLRRQLLRTFLPLSIVPLAIASLIGYRIVDTTARQDIETEVAGITQVMSEAASQLVEDGRRIPLAIASNPYIIDAAKAGASKSANESLTSVPIEQLEQQFDATHLLEVKNYLNDYLVQTAENEGLAELHITERNGFVIAYSNKTSDFVQSDEDWWQLGRQNTQWIVDPEVDESTDTYAVDFLQAITDPSNGEFLGLIQAVLPADHFDRLVDLLEVKLEGSRQLQLVDASSGTVVNTITREGPTDTQVLYGGDALSAAIGALAQAAESNQNAEGALQSVIEQYSLRRVQAAAPTAEDANSELAVTFTHQGRFYSLAKLPGIDWVAIASVDTAEIQAAGLNIALVFLVVAVPLAGVAAFLALWLADQLSTPLKQLSGTAQEVAQGNLGATAKPAGTAETQTLAQIFNNLVASVKGLLQEQTYATEKARLLADITGTQVEHSQDLPSIFNQAVEGARSILKSDRVMFYQFSPDGSGQVVAESVKASLPGVVKSLQPFQIPASLLEQYREGRPVATSHLAKADFPPAYQKQLAHLKTQSNLVAPVFSGDRLLGLLMVDHCLAAHQWQLSEIEFVSQLASQLGLVIDRVTLLEETDALAKEQRNLKESLQRRALELLKEVDPISQGNLTTRARVTEDEIGTIADSYNATVDSLRRLVLQVKETATKVADTTTSSDTYVRDLSTEATRQTVEIADALDQIQIMADAMRAVALRAEQADVAVQEADQTAKAGDEAMNRTVEGIQAIRSTVSATAKKIKHLGESSQRISTVVELISTFAAQTNMLALNASIEASRAGEEGRGFAVVASEVRALAQQSAQASDEIRALVTSIQAETNEVVAAMEFGTEQVVVGTRLVDETRQSFNKITAASATVSELVEAIAQVTAKQSQASTAISTTMTDVAKVADKTSQEANQVSTTFDELTELAQTLQESVGRFKIS